MKFQGGNNAGNTVVKEDGTKIVLHYLSTAAVKNKMSAIAAGVVLNPGALLEEIAAFDDVNLMIDPRTHIIMPYHISMDMAQEHYRNEKAKAGNKGAMGAIGTTHKGIGPAYKDRKDRIGITFHELVSGSKSLEEKIKQNFRLYKKVIENYFGFSMVVPQGGNFGASQQHYTEVEVIERTMEQGKKLRRYLNDVSEEVIALLNKGKNVLFQGSQGVMLDVDWGNYPKVTSSHPTPGTIPTSVGVPLNLLYNMENVGVMKAYLTKVGSGPVATCLDAHCWPVDESRSEKEALHIRAKGHEYGATTKRPRRVGWLDLVQLNYACKMSGLTQLAMTKLDVLEGLEEIKVAYAYEVNGQQTSQYRAWDLEWLANARPIYATLKGFEEGEVSNAKNYYELPSSAKNLVSLVQGYTNVPVTLISTGPKASQTIFKGFKGF